VRVHCTGRDPGKKTAKVILRTRDQRPEKLIKRSGSRAEIGEGVRSGTPEMRERRREEVL
jgi:hypothetical protein